MSRYAIVEGTTREVIVGWDPPLGTFFAQWYGPETPDGEDNLVRWIGYQMREIPTLDELRKTLDEDWGVVIPDNVVEKLAADEAAPWAPGPNQRRLGFTGKEVE